MEKNSDANSYRSIFRSISAFGGVQVFNIFVSLLRGKFVALFLGPEGMGISAVFASSTAAVQQICSLGVNQAVVKEVASAKDKPGGAGKVIKVCARLLLATALLGGIACVLLSPLLSRLAFGDSSHTWSYVWLGLFVALSIAGGGYLAMLQGLGEVKRLSKASLVGGCSGLLFGVPLYWLFGVGGIVPAMIVLAFSTFLFYYISFRASRRDCAPLAGETMTAEDGSNLARRLVSLGMVLLVGGLVGTVTQYAIVLYVKTFGSSETLGFYQAANSITNQYIGIVFSALAMDYFPRLSAVGDDRGGLNTVVNRQIEMVVLVAVPILVCLILTAPLVIRILLTDEFMPVAPLMRWLGLGMMFQAVGFPFGYIFVARGDRRLYFWIECVWCNLLWLACSVGGFHFLGLTGLGVSLVVRNMIDIAVYSVICRRRYGVMFSTQTLRTMIPYILVCTACFCLSLSDSVWAYVSMSLLFLASAAGSAIILKRRFRHS